MFSDDSLELDETFNDGSEDGNDDSSGRMNDNDNEAFSPPSPPPSRNTPSLPDPTTPPTQHQEQFFNVLHDDAQANNIFNSTLSPGDGESQISPTSDVLDRHHVELMAIRTGLSPQQLMKSDEQDNAPENSTRINISDNNNRTNNDKKSYQNKNFNSARAMKNLSTIDDQLYKERRTLDKSGCKSINGLIQRRTTMCSEECRDLWDRSMEARAEVEEQLAILRTLENKAGMREHEDPGGMRISHPRWGFEHLQRTNPNTRGGSKNARASTYVNDSAWAYKHDNNKSSNNTREQIKRSKFKHINKDGAWDGTVFKLNLAKTLYSRLLLKTTFVALRNLAKIAVLRQKMIKRLIKLKGANLLRVGFVGFLRQHLNSLKNRFICFDMWANTERRTLTAVIRGWRKYATCKTLQHKAQDWALLRHHVRRSVHRAFLNFLANRALRIKRRIDKKAADLWKRRVVLARAFIGFKQASSYLRSMRIRTMALVKSVDMESLPSAIGHDEAVMMVKNARSMIILDIQKLRDEKLDGACRRAVGVATRWRAHPLPDQLRVEHYSNYRTRLRGDWVSTFVYNPLEAFLNPTLKLDHGNGDLPYDDYMTKKPLLTSPSAVNFSALKESYERESFAPQNRRKNLGVMIRTLSAFQRLGVAVDPMKFVVKLPQDYTKEPPPASFGLSKEGKITFCTTIKDTAIGVSAVLLVRKVYFKWKDYVGFRIMRRRLFEWGRKRLLKMVWRPLFEHYMTLSTAKLAGKEMGEMIKKRKVFFAWQVFSSERVRGKRKMLKKLFKRRCWVVFKMWRKYAQVKGNRKRRADIMFAKTGKWRGWESFRSWYLDQTRLRRKYNIIMKRRHRKALVDSFRDWYVKIIVNRRLLKRVFSIGLQCSKFADEKRGRRQTSDFYLLRDILFGWRRVVVSILESRSRQISDRASESMWRIGLLCKVFLAWQRYTYVSVVCWEMRNELLLKLCRKALVMWGRWSYKVSTFRYKVSVFRRLEWAWKGFVIGVGVSRMGRSNMLKKTFARWVSGWQERYIIVPRSVCRRRLLKKIFVEWKWCVAWSVSEKRCGLEESRRLKFLPRRIDGTASQAPFAVETDTISREYTHYGKPAVTKYYQLVLSRKIFSWWSGVSFRHRKLRRNLGRLSRLAYRYRLLDAFSRFPTFGWEKKVQNFRVKKMCKKVFRSWRGASKKFALRMQQEGLAFRLRERGAERLDDMDLGEIDEDADYVGPPRSFIEVVPVTMRSRLSVSFGGWKLQMLLGRRAKLEGIRMEKMQGVKVKRAVFEKWKAGTHFIARRVSFNEEEGVFRFSGGSRKVGGLQPWSEAKMANFLNKTYQNMGTDSYVSDEAHRYSVRVGVNAEGVNRRIDSAIAKLNLQYGMG